jgi:hypothetical protein
VREKPLFTKARMLARLKMGDSYGKKRAALPISASYHIDKSGNSVGRVNEVKPAIPIIKSSQDAIMPQYI